jgi:Bacteriophage T4-like portal protein (Gp20)
LEKLFNMDVFGFEIKRKKPEPVSFSPKQNDDGAVVVAEGGVYGTYVDLDGAVRTESELVNKYREIAQHPTVELAIDDIVNEVITQEPENKIVELILDDLDQPERIKKLLIEEFEKVLNLLEFNEIAYEVFKRWYVDGRLYYHAIVDEKDLKAGITELRYIDPRKIRKIREIKKKRSPTDIIAGQTATEYYIYNDKGFSKTSGSSASPTNSSATGLKIAKDSIIHVTSGQLSPGGDLIQSHIHKAIKPLNQLRSMEDSLVIYRISRAPERRIFYIDVGNLPKMKAEQYLRDQMTRFKNKVVYDSASGEIRDDRKFMTMLEDFWLPRREGGRGTEITTLPGGQNLGNIEDIVYFQQNLYRSLNVPISRLDPQIQFGIGRGNEITRDEVKFAKFTNRLRNKFSVLFSKILERQLVLKGIITIEDWDLIKQKINFKFAQDNYYAELKETEVLRDRISILGDVSTYAGIYYSHEWIRRHILRQTDEDIEEINKQIAEELNNVQYNPPEEDPSQSSPQK